MTKTKTLQVRLDPLQMAKIDAEAKDAGLSRSEMLRRILEREVHKDTTGEVKLVTREMMEEKNV